MARRHVASEGHAAGDADVARLYGLPLSEFTRARNALAVQLKKAGRTAEAAAVQRLIKPSPPVWSLNQAVRQDPDAAARFIEAVERLRATQAARPAELAAATERQRAELGQLVRRGRVALTGAGFSDSPEMMARITKTLLGAAVGRQGDLRAGRLTEELALPGFEALAGVPPELAPRPDEAATPPHRPRGESAASQREREQREGARQALKVAEAEAEEWQQRADTLERAAGQHRGTLVEAEAAVKELRVRLQEAEGRVTEARRSVEQADREADRARREAECASAKRKAAEKAVPIRRD